MAVPLFSPTAAEEAKITRRSSEASELSKPPGLLTLCFHDTPNSTQENQAPAPLELGPVLALTCEPGTVGVGNRSF